jgi:hypothetical protein
MVSSYAVWSVTANHAIAAYFSIDQFALIASASAGGSISPSGSVAVNYGGNQTFTVAPTTGCHIDSLVVDGANQGVLSSYAFSNVTANHAISAYFSIDRFTLTASASAGGSISPSGSVFVDFGGNQSFTITPTTGHHIDSVVVDGVNQGAVGTYAFSSVTENHTIAVHFSIDQFTLTASASAGGSISPSGSVSVDYGSSQSFTVTPATGHHVDSVLVDGVNQGAIGSYAFSNVTANHVIAAYFSIDRYIINASASAGGSISPSGAVSVDHGGSQGFTVAPATGYHSDSVVVDGINIGTPPGYTFTNVTSHHVISAWFSTNVYTIAASAGPHGSITPSGSVPAPHGSDRSFVITPDPGYHVDSVLVDGGMAGTGLEYAFTNITSPHTIRALFAVDSHAITATSGPHGAIAPSGTIQVPHGGTQTFLVTPETGCHVDSILVDGSFAGAPGSYTFTNVAGPHSIHAVCSLNRYTITTAASPNGSIIPAGPVTVVHGSTRTFTFAPSTGYHVDSVLIDGVNVGVIDAYTFNDITADHSVAAYFSLTMLTITADAGPNGTMVPSGIVAIPYGGTRRFVVTPGAGYHVEDLVVDGTPTDSTTGYTFAGVTADHIITATFAIDRFTILASAGPHGAISPAGLDTLDYGEDRTYVITPESGYEVLDVTVDGVPQGPLGSYTFFSVSAPHVIAASFRIRQVTVVLTPSQGWNLMSVPLLMEDYRRTVLFPTAITGAVGFQGSYHLRDTLDNGDGYWLKFGAAESIPMTGGIRPVDTVEVQAGWNLVGVLSADIPSASVIPIGTELETYFFGFNGAYSIGTMLQAGRGYWVKVSTAGRLLLQATAEVPGAAGPVTPGPSGLRTLTFVDATGNAQTLYFGTAATADSLRIRYELPPVPPDGVFDVRFASGGLVHTRDVSGGRMPEQPILVSGMQFPIRIRWSGTGDEDLHCMLEYAAGGKWNAIHLTAGEHEAVIEGPAATGFLLKPSPGELPRVFSLGQNFPNPFNPSTQVEVMIPRPGRVRLSVFDQLGREVAVLVDEDLEAGTHRRTFDGANMASGVYYYRLSAGDFSATRRMVLLK